MKEFLVSVPPLFHGKLTKIVVKFAQKRKRNFKYSQGYVIKIRWADIFLTFAVFVNKILWYFDSIQICWYGTTWKSFPALQRSVLVIKELRIQLFVFPTNCNWTTPMQTNLDVFANFLQTLHHLKPNLCWQYIRTKRGLIAETVSAN